MHRAVPFVVQGLRWHAPAVPSPPGGRSVSAGPAPARIDGARTCDRLSRHCGGRVWLGRAPGDSSSKAARGTYSQALNVAIGDWSVRTSTWSSERRAKARHRATSSQLSKVPWSSPVVSSTTVYCGG